LKRSGRWLRPAAAASLVGLTLAAHPARADNQGPRPVVEARPAATSSGRHQLAKTPARKPARRPDASGNFVYEILSNIRARSSELCARYNSPDDCLEEAEVCLTMRNSEDDEVRMCLTTAPGEDERESAKKARWKRR
jgi:hypothetical protein